MKKNFRFKIIPWGKQVEIFSWNGASCTKIIFKTEFSPHKCKLSSHCKLRAHIYKSFETYITVAKYTKSFIGVCIIAQAYSSNILENIFCHLPPKFLHLHDQQTLIIHYFTMIH